MDAERRNEPPPKGEPIASAKTMLADAGQTLGQEAAQLASSAKSKASEGLSGQKEIATQTIATFADAIRKAGDDLAEHDQSALGRVVKQAADGLAGMSRSVADKSPEQLLHTVRDFGRNNPVAFIAGSVLIGVALGRFARSSAQHSAAPEGTAQGQITASPPASLAPEGEATMGLRSTPEQLGGPLDGSSEIRPSDVAAPVSPLREI